MTNPSSPDSPTTAAGESGARAPAADPSLPLVDQARRVCTGRLRAEALVTEALARARAAAPLNAFVTLDEAGALAAARAVDDATRRRGPRRCPPLAGVTIVVKDNIHVAGLPSTAGTPALKDHVPMADAPVVARLRAAGAVVIGKTQMHELALGVSGWNPSFLTGPEPGVRNPYDPGRSAGGSSSGTGAAIGARVVAAGLGTDTGGSVRIPGAFNGVAALRPTVGRYPNEGIAPIAPTRDTAGPMALSVADVALLDRVIAGGPLPRPAALARLRLGLARALCEDLDADTQAAFDSALARLRAAGAALVEVEMPALMQLSAEVGFAVALHEAHDAMVAYLARYCPRITLDALAGAIASPDVAQAWRDLVLPRKLPGPGDTLVDSNPLYRSAMTSARPALRRLYAQTFARHRLDALVFPTVPQVAMPAGPDASSMLTFARVIRNTDPGSNAGLPGLQLPIALGVTTRLPVGLALDGAAGSDRRLLAIGLAMETLFGRLPPPRGRDTH